MNIQQIKFLQLDPFGYCNAKCWFCPVKYIPQPEEGSGSMNINLIDKILSEIYEEKHKQDGVVHPNFNLIALSHYNEILLYKHFEELLQLLRKFSFKCMVLSNGVSLSKNKTDVIFEYKDVVSHVGLNIPAFERDLWAKRSGFSPDTFDRLIENVKYAEQRLSHLRGDLQIGVNGFDKTVVDGGYLTTGSKFNDENYELNPSNGEHETQLRLAKKMFPGINVHKNYLYDRAGTIDHIATNKPYLRKIQQGKKVVGCNNGGDRSKEWLNINSAGSVFLCCNDYNFDYIFGNVKDQTIREIWLSEKRNEVVKRAYSEICTNCYSAVLQ
jgi:radical SAM protein with 4Fe4S-binding SPASM domain